MEAFERQECQAAVLCEKKIYKNPIINIKIQLNLKYIYKNPI
jgi:hypothetical protein